MAAEEGEDHAVVEGVSKSAHRHRVLGALAHDWLAWGRHRHIMHRQCIVAGRSGWRGSLRTGPGERRREVVVFILNSTVD